MWNPSPAIRFARQFLVLAAIPAAVLLVVVEPRSGDQPDPKIECRDRVTIGLRPPYRIERSVSRATGERATVSGVVVLATGERAEFFCELALSDAGVWEVTAANVGAR